MPLNIHVSTHHHLAALGILVPPNQPRGMVNTDASGEKKGEKTTQSKLPPPSPSRLPTYNLFRAKPNNTVQSLSTPGSIAPRPGGEQERCCQKKSAGRILKSRQGIVL
ncbi:hypothetical protein PoB_001422300 [Plakobranchus ocellatus]|uniref:Uncharacterized protein n=1 Tax=Plakobranchus ocellatus TaxID=259542 RepID=A0AAV3YZC0_9GAST|nr:hypothetical protein PoB_001422300 [Plakobranchus ocellatus]